MDDLNYQYQLDRDKVADDQWAQQWAYQQERDKVADEQWQKEYDEMVRQYNENMAWQQAQAAAAASRSSSGGGGGRSSGSGGMTDYQKTEAMLANGGYNSAQMLQIIRTSPLSKAEQDTLKAQYQTPKAKQEVNAQDPRKDTSAYWSSR